MGWMSDGNGRYACSKCSAVSGTNFSDCGQCALIASQRELVDIQRSAADRQSGGVYSGGGYPNDGPDWGPAMVMGPLAILFGLLAMGNVIWAFPCVFCAMGFISCFT